MPELPNIDNAHDRILETVQIEVSVCVGHARPTMAELSKLSAQDVLSLNTSVDDPVSLYVGKRIIAEGILEELSEGAVAGGISVRVTRILQRQEG